MSLFCMISSKSAEMTTLMSDEARIDQALEDSFPASDPPYFVGAGAKPGEIVLKTAKRERSPASRQTLRPRKRAIT